MNDTTRGGGDNMERQCGGGEGQMPSIYIRQIDMCLWYTFLSTLYKYCIIDVDIMILMKGLSSLNKKKKYCNICYITNILENINLQIVWTFKH